jgi:hypothetical protein
MRLSCHQGHRDARLPRNGQSRGKGAGGKGKRGLLITDDFVRELIRHTEDIDLIVEAVVHGE